MTSIVWLLNLGCEVYSRIRDSVSRLASSGSLRNECVGIVGNADAVPELPDDPGCNAALGDCLPFDQTLQELIRGRLLVSHARFYVHPEHHLKKADMFWDLGRVLLGQSSFWYSSKKAICFEWDGDLTFDELITEFSKRWVEDAHAIVGMNTNQDQFVHDCASMLPSDLLSKKDGICLSVFFFRVAYQQLWSDTPFGKLNCRGAPKPHY